MADDKAEILLVGLEEELARALSELLDDRDVSARRVPLTQLAEAEATGLLVLAAGATFVISADRLRPFTLADRPVVVLSDDPAAAEHLRSVSSVRVVHLPATDLPAAAMRLGDMAAPADWASTATVRPPPGMLPEEIEREMGLAPAAERPRNDDDVTELDSGLLESVRPSGHPAAAPVHAPPPPAVPRTEAADVPQPEHPAASGRRGAIVAAALVAVAGAAAVALWVSSGSEAPVDPGTDAPPAREPIDRVQPSAARSEGPDDAPSDPRTAEPAEPGDGEDEQPTVASAEPSSPGASPYEWLASARASGTETNPNHSDRLVLEAGRQIAAGELDAARASLRQALDLDPDNPRAYAWIGRLQIARGQGGSAAEWLQLAVDKRSRRAEYHLWLGDALQLAGDEPAARQAWTKALQRDPENAEARARLRR